MNRPTPVAVTGSAAADSVSLTVTDVADPEQTVSGCRIPSTWDLTRLGTPEPGTCVNLKVDVPPTSMERLPDALDGW